MSLAEQTVLITGGTGSFGHTMASRLLELGCSEVRIFSRDEAKQEAMRIAYANKRLRFYIGDVRNRESITRAMKGVDLVFHAAALKQVPSCEFFPVEALRTNVIGSNNIIEVGIAHGVRAIVCLSTDKAVYPINAMGMAKGLMEKVVQAAARQHDGATATTVSCVRYGNVMYSRGSVIPLFVEQLMAQKPLTITAPEMTRFMLPLSDAVQLVEFALLHARSGDVFIRKAPACTIGDLATAVAQLLDLPLEVKVIGMRHGEKLYETLATKEELRRAEDLVDYYRLPMDGRDLNYDEYFVEGDPEEASMDDYHSHNAERLDVDGVIQLLLRVPEMMASAHGNRYVPPGQVR